MSAALKKIHIAKKNLGLDDETYRGLLIRITGKVSSGKMTEKEREAVLAEMQRLGWSKSASGPSYKLSDKPYIRLMFALAKKLDDLGYWQHPFREGLRLFVKKRTGIDNPEWLTFDQASPVIEALKEIERRLS